MLGKFLGEVTRVVNAPLRAVEDLFSDGECPEDERMLSRPLDALADNLEDADDEV